MTDGIQTVLGGEVKPSVIVGGEGADAEIDTRKVQPLARAQLTADTHAAADLGALDLEDLQQDEAVVEKESVARLHGRREVEKAHRDPRLVADDVLGRQGEDIVAQQLDRLLAEIADAHLRAGQVAHDGHAPPGGFRGFADPPDQRPVIVRVAVGEVQSGHVHTGLDQGAEHLG